MNIKQNKRLRELDFLRGIAILLVLMRHQYLSGFTKTMGWIGVDLFFVLSGFLVSGLLFKEYLRFGDIKPSLFLIRRGFKIYPIYYLTYILYLTPKIIKHQFNLTGFLADLFFIQNYVWGWGYAYVPSWSLAVEEHFYFGFAILFWLTIKYLGIDLKSDLEKKRNKFETVIVLIMLICLFLRLISNIYFHENGNKNYTMSHLRIDSLLSGVFVSYLYYFKREKLIRFFESNKTVLLLLSVIMLSFTPFVDVQNSFFVMTFGFLFIYISFGILLIYFLTTQQINEKLDSLFTRKIVDIICKIGFSSYSIYLIHGFVNFAFNLANMFVFSKVVVNQTATFFITSIVSVILGILITLHLEKYFLNYRDKYFPSRMINDMSNYK